MKRAVAYYNEIDPFAAQWLRNLIDAGHIAPGEVDERSIADVQPGDIEGFTQCHFFAGIGIWSHALRLAGWPDDRPVWTGSCPCQPFSDAGKGDGFNDERHLWPQLFRLVRELRPPALFGEQVSSKDGLLWFDAVSSDLEGEEYAVGALDLCAAGVGAPHLRQRLYFVADSKEIGRRTRRAGVESRRDTVEPHRHGKNGGMAETDGGRLPQLRGMGDSRGSGGGRNGGAAPRAQEEGERARRVDGREPDEPLTPGVHGMWDSPDWVYCRDPGGPRWRAVEPGAFPLAHGYPQRVGRLRAYGNAIVAPIAAEFIGAVMECVGA